MLLMPCLVQALKRDHELAGLAICCGVATDSQAADLHAHVSGPICQATQT